MSNVENAIKNENRGGIIEVVGSIILIGLMAYVAYGLVYIEGMTVSEAAIAGLTIAALFGLWSCFSTIGLGIKSIMQSKKHKKQYANSEYTLKTLKITGKKEVLCVQGSPIKVVITDEFNLGLQVTPAQFNKIEKGDEIKVLYFNGENIPYVVI